MKIKNTTNGIVYFVEKNGDFVALMNNGSVSKLPLSTFNKYIKNKIFVEVKDK